MENQSSPPVVSFLPVSFFLVLVGWGGIAALVISTDPWASELPIWLFFFLSVLGFTGIGLPIVAYLNQRFQSEPPATYGIVLRQAIWFGIYFPFLARVSLACTRLEISRAVVLPFGLILAAVLIIIEWLLRFWERSQWKPDSQA